MLTNKDDNNYMLKRKKEYNIGIGILRVCLSFMVVMDHLYNQKKYKQLYLFLLLSYSDFFLAIILLYF